jgi:hypothetical protein
MTEHNLPRGIAIALLVGFSCFGVRAALAAETQKGPGAREETAVSDKELQAFVKAYVDYQKIRASYGPALDNAKDPQRKKQIEQEANTKVKQSLDTQGLTAERYNRIFAQVNSNEPLRKRVLKQVEDERKKS